MHLKQIEANRTHLSHFMKYVSAYYPSEERVQDLENMLNEALKKAREKKEMVIVEQDCLQHVFIVYPSGRIGLYRQVGTYEVVEV